MKTTYKLALYALLLLMWHCKSVQCQSQESFDALMPMIESRLSHTDGGIPFQFILELVRDRCGDDFECLHQVYNEVMISLESQFHLSAAIFVGEEIVRIARQWQEPEKEATAHRNIHRYFNALGLDRQSVEHLNQALYLFEKAGDQTSATITRINLLEESLERRSITEVLPEMRALLARAEARSDSTSINYLHYRMVFYTLSAGKYVEAEKYITALEKVPVSDPPQKNEYRHLITVARGKAALAMHRRNIEEAQQYYLEALRFTREKPDRWNEIRVLQFLCELEWERGNTELAKSYLEMAYQNADHLELHDLLAYHYELETRIAEAEDRYADALESIKKKYLHEAAFEDRGAGFDLERFYLGKDKERLTSDKELSDHELHDKQVQLRNTRIITILVLLLMAGLAIGLFKHRKGMRQLSRQHALISQQAKQMRTLDKAKSRFFANVSHELRTPLSLMLGPVRSLLKDPRLSERQSRLLQMASGSGDQLLELVDEILDLGKLELGKLEMKVKPTSLGLFFRNYFSQFESMAQHRQIDYTFDVQIHDGLAADIDQDMNRQILYNLLANAFKFTPSGGRIEATVSVENDALILEVRDSGSGVHPDDLPHVFDRYFQTSLPDKPVEGGTGIGLALCSEYARLFGGNIEVESELGKGSVFRVKFPVRVSSGIPDMAPMSSLSLGVIHGKNDQPIPPHDASKSTILVVEDNFGLQDYISMILSEKYNVLTAENGQAALNFLHSFELCGPEPGNCHLILSDLMMPVMDGFQFLEKLKSNDATRHIPVIMLTAREDVHDKLRALRIGVDDYILKPFDEEELMVRIENLLKNMASRREEVPESTLAGKTGPPISAHDREWLEFFETFVRDNLSSDMLSVSLMAREFTMSESTLLRQLKRLTGLTPAQYLREVRLEHARQLLENHRYRSVTEVANEVGYGDVRSFSRSFRQRFGRLPSEVFRDAV